MKPAAALISLVIVAVAMIPGETSGAKPSCHSCADGLVFDFLWRDPDGTGGTQTPLLEVSNVEEGSTRTPFCTEGKEKWSPVDTPEDDETSYRCVDIFYHDQEILVARGKMLESDLLKILIDPETGEKVTEVPPTACTKDFKFDADTVNRPGFKGEICVCSTELCNSRINGAYLGAQASVTMLVLSALVSVFRIFA